MGRKDYHVIWTVYFDSSRSRNLGRKVSKKLAVKNPTIEDLVKAVEKLGLEFEVFPDKKYPKTWFEDSCRGYVIVYKREGLSKTKLLRMISEKLREIKSG